MNIRAVGWICKFVFFCLGLVAAAYLALGGAEVCVLERRHVIGGAAVTEEIVPGFKFSRASYLLR